MDHDAKRVLARTRSGNLRLTEDSQGLEFEISVPDTTFGADVLELAERGDLGGMSFGFVVQGRRTMDGPTPGVGPGGPFEIGGEHGGILRDHRQSRSKTPRLNLANYYLRRSNEIFKRIE